MLYRLKIKMKKKFLQLESLSIDNNYDINGNSDSSPKLMLDLNSNEFRNLYHPREYLIN